MSAITMVQAIKEVHKTDIAMVKIGEFYHVYGKDAYIVSYLFEYKLGLIENKYVTCGFPAKSLAKIKAILEQKRINYIVLDRRNNYLVDEISDHKNLNNYEEIYEKAYKYVIKRNRIQKIYEYLLKNINQKETMEKIKGIEKIINEK